MILFTIDIKYDRASRNSGWKNSPLFFNCILLIKNRKDLDENGFMGFTFLSKYFMAVLWKSNRPFLAGSTCRAKSKNCIFYNVLLERLEKRTKSKQQRAKLKKRLFYFIKFLIYILTIQGKLIIEWRTWIIMCLVRLSSLSKLSPQCLHLKSLAPFMMLLNSRVLYETSPAGPSRAELCALPTFRVGDVGDGSLDFGDVPRSFCGCCGGAVDGSERIAWVSMIFEYRKKIWKSLKLWKC